MDNKQKKWIDAAIILGKDRTAKIVCPDCGKGILEIIEVPIKEWKKIDCYLICNSCGKRNVLTMNKPENK